MNSIIKAVTENPLVSIIVPVYNSEPFLDQCLKSLVNQTLSNIEIIVIDDGSTDKSPEICDAYARQDKRIRVIHQKNSGYGKSCNTAIASSKCKYFGIIESDDYAEPEMFEKLYNLAITHNLDVVRCHFYWFNSVKNTNKRIDLSHIPQNKVYSPRNVFSSMSREPAIWSMLYQKHFITENNIKFLETPGASYQDLSFSFKVNACAQRYMLTDGTFVHYRIDNENSSSYSEEKLHCVYDEFREIENFLEERDLQKIFSPIIPKIKFPTYMWNYRRMAKKHRWVFLRKISREMRGYIFNRKISIKVFSAKDLLKVYVLAFLFPLIYVMYRTEGNKTL